MCGAIGTAFGILAPTSMSWVVIYLVVITALLIGLQAVMVATEDVVVDE